MEKNLVGEVEPGAAMVIGLLRCPRCGSAESEAVSDGEMMNFLCRSCWSCWHVELGFVHHVDPTTCPGCQHRGECLSRLPSPD